MVKESCHNHQHKPAEASEREVIYTCPMHPEVQQDHPGDCPKCGMALEPMVTEGEEENYELADMTRRFWVSVIFALPVFISAMGSEFWPEFFSQIIEPRAR